MTLAHERLVYAFPHAGASALLYRKWVRDIGSGSRLVLRPVELPGRGRLVRERPITDLHDLAERLAADIESDWRARQNGEERDWATFGHSFGGVLSVLVTSVLAEQYGLTPAFSVVSCSVPPCRQTADSRHDWSDDRILQQAARDGATPPALLKEPIMARQVASQMRADYLIRRQFLSYRHMTVNHPLRLIAARDDVHVSVATVQAWQNHTRQQASLARIDGDHFAVYQQFPRVCRELVREASLAETLC